MSRKKEHEKSFRHDPFKRLKGFGVSAPQSLPAVKPPVPVPAPVAASDEAGLFAEEMARLGVAGRPGAAGEEPAPPAPPEEPQVNREVPPLPTERELFLAALGGMSAVFADEVPAAEEAPAQPRRMRQVRRGELLPEAQLDLHGLTRDQARERVRFFLDDAVYQGRRTVLIVTGRGKSSAGEPVLRAEIERYLAHDAAAWVAEWGRAPARFGGEGALVVFLKGRKGQK